MRSPDSRPPLPRARRSRRGRRVVLALGAVGFIAALAWILLLAPLAAARTFLTVLAATPPTMADVEAVGGRVEGEGGRRCLVVPGPSADAPEVVLVAGVTVEGVRDPRVLRLAVALRAAGLAVRAPELPGLVRLGEDPDLVPPVVEAWKRALGANGRRRAAMLGVSVGAGVVLRAIARGHEGDPPPDSVSALLLVGPPDDTAVLARAWFTWGDAPVGADAVARARASSGRFARRGIVRAAASRLLEGDDLATMRAWLDALGEDPIDRAVSPGLASPGLRSPAGLRLARAVVAEASLTDADRDWILDAAGGFLAACSPAAMNVPARVTAPVFVIHGADDPLVPAAQGRALGDRLRGAAPTEWLESRLLAHVEVGEAGLLDRWTHLRFAGRFLEAAGVP